MRSPTVIILLTFVTQAHAVKDLTNLQDFPDDSADNLVHKLFDRARKAWSLHQPILDKATTGKPCNSCFFPGSIPHSSLGLDRLRARRQSTAEAVEADTFPRASSSLSVGSQVGSDNLNRPLMYTWTRSLIDQIARGDATRLATQVSKPATPLFIVMGACPSLVCGVQAMLYVAPDNGRDPNDVVEFWWIKPQKSDQDQLEQNTLTLRSTGKHKNNPERSRVGYQLFADWFKPRPDQGGPSFELMTCTGCSAARAVMRLEGDAEPLFLLYVWQERWAGLKIPFKKKRFMKGAVVYQRGVAGADYPSGDLYARGYIVNGDTLEILDNECPLSREEMFSERMIACTPP